MKEQAYLTTLAFYGAVSPMKVGDLAMVSGLAAAGEGGNGIECNFSTTSYGQQVSSVYEGTFNFWHTNFKEELT